MAFVFVNSKNVATRITRISFLCNVYNPNSITWLVILGVFLVLDNFTGAFFRNGLGQKTIIFYFSAAKARPQIAIIWRLWYGTEGDKTPEGYKTEKTKWQIAR